MPGPGGGRKGGSPARHRAQHRTGSRSTGSDALRAGLWVASSGLSEVQVHRGQLRPWKGAVGVRRSRIEGGSSLGTRAPLISWRISDRFGARVVPEPG